MAKGVTELDKKTFDKFIKEDKVVVDFWAAWCGPCKILSPAVEEAANEMKDKAKFAKVNVDENLELAQRFQVMSIPTLIFFRDGKQMDRTVGVISKEEIEKRIKNLK